MLVTLSQNFETTLALGSLGSAFRDVVFERYRRIRVAERPRAKLR